MCLTYITINNLQLVFSLLIGALAVCTVNCENVDNSGHIAHILEVVRGGVTNIPCNISLNTSGDKVQTVIWYKEEIIHSQTPLYTFDVRGKDLSTGVHWSDEAVLGGRGYFRHQDEPSKLVIIDVKESDAGVYQCRVDFQYGPTQYSKANLSVITPPEKILIADEKGNHINHYIIGPYLEGDLVNITCIVIGGHPQPNVTWWRENTLLDSNIDSVHKRKIKNILYLQPLHRKDLHTILTCQATNCNKAIPISTSITIEMNLKPLKAKLNEKLKVLSAESTYELSCTVVGSRPRPIITWWLENQQLTDTREIANVDNDTTTSFLNFTPLLNDHRKRIHCKAYHPFIADSVVEDKWLLHINHIPPNILKFDPSVDKNDIKEGSDVEIHCEVQSNLLNAPVINFQHNGKDLYNDPSSGIIMYNHSLVLKNIDKAQSGQYTCTAHNFDGMSKSNVLTLNVKYAPVCRPGQIKIYRVDLNTQLEVPCDLEANPSRIQFVWKFKYADGKVVKISDHLITTKNTTSVVQYSPTSEDDYPTLICAGSNDAGVQEKPCIFNLISTASPDALQNCKVIKQTENSLDVECIDEFNRGIRGEFIMELYNAQTGKLVQNVTSLEPTFTVTGLESGIGFDVDLYVVNNERRSIATRLQTFTLTHTTLSDDSLLISIYNLAYVLAGVVGSLILIAVLIVIVVRYRGNPEFTEEANTKGFEGSSGCYLPVGSDKFNKQTGSNTSYDSFDTDSPDIMT